MKNRSRYEVIAAILKSVGKEETRTKIMYKAMLSNDQCKLYLDSRITYDEAMIASDSATNLAWLINQNSPSSRLDTSSDHEPGTPTMRACASNVTPPARSPT